MWLIYDYITVIFMIYDYIYFLYSYTWLYLYYDYILVCVDDNVSRSFKSLLCKDVVYKFINSIIKEIKYCTDIMEKHFSK